jgi:hypothetical protein
MSVQHRNRKGQTCYLHQGSTKTGKPKYFFSMKKEGTLAGKVPDGFEVYENPNAQVFLRRIGPKIITDEEVALVEEGMKRFCKLKYYQIDVKKNRIVVYQPVQDVDALAEVFHFISGARGVLTAEQLGRRLTYAPMLRFELIDDAKREFMTQRYCFLGSIDDWIYIGGPDDLRSLVKKYVKHLGEESFFELD